jgi:hypothetical protein
VSFPITVPLVTIEIKRLILSDTQPTPQEGYEIALIKDLGWTKLWMEYKITTA